MKKICGRAQQHSLFKVPAERAQAEFSINERPGDLTFLFAFDLARRQPGSASGTRAGELFPVRLCIRDAGPRIMAYKQVKRLFQSLGLRSAVVCKSRLNDLQAKNTILLDVPGEHFPDPVHASDS